MYFAEPLDIVMFVPLQSPPFLSFSLCFIVNCFVLLPVLTSPVCAMHYEHEGYKAFNHLILSDISIFSPSLRV